MSMISLVLLKVIFYFGPFLGAFWGSFFIFLRLLKQIQVHIIVHESHNLLIYIYIY